MRKKQRVGAVKATAAHAKFSHRNVWMLHIHTQHTHEQERCWILANSSSKCAPCYASSLNTPNNKLGHKEDEINPSCEACVHASVSWGTRPTHVLYLSTKTVNMLHHPNRVGSDGLTDWYRALPFPTKINIHAGPMHIILCFLLISSFKSIKSYL